MTHFDRSEVLEIHRALIEEFGGLGGIRDSGLLESALARAFTGFGEVEFYPSTPQKAAAILESIIMNHPFLDGNKRTGYFLMLAILAEENLELNASLAERYEFVIQVAEGKLNHEEMVKWIENRIVIR